MERPWPWGQSALEWILSSARLSLLCLASHFPALQSLWRINVISLGLTMLSCRINEIMQVQHKDVEVLAFPPFPLQHQEVTLLPSFSGGFRVHHGHYLSHLHAPGATWLQIDGLPLLQLPTWWKSGQGSRSLRTGCCSLNSFGSRTTTFHSIPISV